MSLKLKRMVRILIPVAILAAVVAVLLAVGGKNTVSDGFCFTRLDDGTYGVRLVRAPDNEDVVIPAEFKGKKVSRILSDFAAYTGSTYGVERKMYKLTVPDSVKVIEDNAFKDWQWLDSVVLPASEITLGEYAFAGSELREIVFPEGITVSLIPEGAFMDCERLAYIEIPGSVTEIGDRAFEDCGFTGELSLEDTFIQRIGGRAFRDCKQLYKVTLPKSLISLEADAFKGCARLIQVTDLSDVRVTDGAKDRLPDSVRLVNYLKDDRFTTDAYGYVFWRGEQFPFLVGVVEKALSVGG
ncbi:MAG: leucine-rich repeat protein, partial [Clostridia bacterium]|nr:leucine-rich repeat protein [Clostridia bacterium]